MKNFSDTISAEKEDMIRKDLGEMIEKSLDFHVEKLSIIGNSRSDLKTFVNRTRASYGIEIVLTQQPVRETAKQLIQIDDKINELFDSIKLSRVIGNETYINVPDNDFKMHDEKTRIQLIRVEYWIDPEVIENSKIFKSLLTINKYNL